MIELLIQVKELVFSKTVKQTSIVFLGNAISSFLAIVFTILAARFLGPKDWGIVAAIGSFISILMALADFGLGASLLRFVSEKYRKGKTDKVQNISRTVFFIRVLTAVSFLVVLVIFSPWLAPLVLRLSEPKYIVFSAIALLGFLFLDFQTSLVQAKENWKLSAIFISITNTLRVIGIFVLVLTQSVSLFSVVVVFTTTPFLGWIATLFSERTRPELRKGWQKIVKHMAPFSLWMALGKIVNTVNSRVDVLLLIQLTGAYETGIYSAANRLAFGVPMILGSFARVLAPKFASLKDRELKVYFKKSVGLSLLIAIGLLVGIIISPLVISLFGVKYSQSTPILRWLFLAFIPFVLSTPSVNVLIYGFQKPNILTLMGLIQLPFIFALNLYLIPVIGVYGPVLTLGLVNLSTMMVTYYFALRNLYEKT
jgi:PST family polysaccharide transporter